MSVRVAVLRSAVPLLVLCSAAVAPTAGATDASCVVLTDDAGDTFPAAGAGPSDPSLDLLRVVFRSDGVALHVRMTVGSGGKPATRAWNVRFDDGERYYSVVALEELDGDGFFAFGPGNATNQPSRGRITGRLDLSSGIIDMTVPLKQLGLSATARFYEFLAEASMSVGDVGNGLPVEVWNSVSPMPTDEASGTRSYQVNRGCAKTY